jgi:hypothetical protein
MLRRSIVALIAIAVAVLVPEAALARGGFGGFKGGGYHGSGYHMAAVRTGTFANNAWRTGFYPGYRPWRRIPVAPVAAAAVVGAGLAYGAYPYSYYDNAYYGGGYAYYPPYDYDGNYVYNAGGYYGDGGCTIIQRRIPTPYGWVLRPVQICN